MKVLFAVMVINLWGMGVEDAENLQQLQKILREEVQMETLDAACKSERTYQIFPLHCINLLQLQITQIADSPAWMARWQELSRQCQMTSDKLVNQSDIRAILQNPSLSEECLTKLRNRLDDLQYIESREVP